MQEQLFFLIGFLLFFQWCKMSPLLFLNLDELLEKFPGSYSYCPVVRHDSSPMDQIIVYNHKNILFMWSRNKLGIHVAKARSH